jgi:hypothetical protein
MITFFFFKTIRKMYFLLVEVCCNAKKDAYQDDVNCEVPS